MVFIPEGVEERMEENNFSYFGVQAARSFAGLEGDAQSLLNATSSTPWVETRWDSAFNFSEEDRRG
jgi:hypothetical protein